MALCAASNLGVGLAAIAIHGLHPYLIIINWLGKGQIHAGIDIRIEVADSPVVLTPDAAKGATLLRGILRAVPRQLHVGNRQSDILVGGRLDRASAANDGDACEIELKRRTVRILAVPVVYIKLYLDKCLGYLTGFVYENLEKKRFRAIEDMRIACEDSISERERTHNDTWLKEFIHLYFNSKYARMGYQVNGKDYSLTEDTDQQGRDGYDVVRKYIDVISNDGSGSEIDNVKHLYGATLLCLRAHPDNAALQLLLTYCITFLGTGTNETLKSNAFNGYIDGFIALYDKDNEEVWDNLAHFNECLAAKVHQDDTYIKENIIEKGEDAVMLFIHGNKLEDITNRFLDNNVNIDNKTMSNDSDETI